MEIKNSYPKLILKKDRKLDLQNGLDFFTYNVDKKFQKWFLPDELHNLVDRKVSAKGRNKGIMEYVEMEYKTRSKEIAGGAEKAAKDWKKIEKRYFQKVSKIFNGRPWPKGKYVGFASIFFMFPRWIKEKRFSFPSDDRIFSSNSVIAHEMLHFMFFDFIKERYGLEEEAKIKGKSANYVWQVSEVFNNVVFNSNLFADILKEKEKPYPGTEKMYEKMRKQWAKDMDAEALLDTWFEKK